MLKLPIKNPSPDFETFKRVLKGEKEPDRVHFVEAWVDEEIRQFITENLMDERWVPAPPESSALRESRTVSLKQREAYWRQNINFFYRLGYDFFPDMDAGFNYLASFVAKTRVADDTASLSAGKRVWAEEGKGMITSWEEYEKFPWGELEKMKSHLGEYYDFLSRNLPEGMKISVSCVLFEFILEWVLGYEGLFYLIYDQPDLVRTLFERLGKIVYDFYSSVITMDSVGVIWHADDLGYKNSTMLHQKGTKKKEGKLIPLTT